MGSGCCKHKDFSPNYSLTKIVRRYVHQVCPPGGPSLRKATPATNHITKSSEMEGEEGVATAKPARKGVSFVGVDETPKPPPRARKRGSRSRKGATSPCLEVEGSSTSAQGHLTPDSQDSDVEVVGNSRLPELLRRDTFCDALDFKLYSFGRFPGRRASSLEQLGAELVTGLGGGNGGLPPSRSAEELSQPTTVIAAAPMPPPMPPPQPPVPQPTIQQSKQSFLNNILNETTAPRATSRLETPAIVVSADDLAESLGKLAPVPEEIGGGKGGYTVVYSSSEGPPSREPSISESLQEFETSIYDMLKAKAADSDDEPQPPPR